MTTFDKNIIVCKYVFLLFFGGNYFVRSTDLKSVRSSERHVSPYIGTKSAGNDSRTTRGGRFPEPIESFHQKCFFADTGWFFQLYVKPRLGESTLT